MREVSPRSPVSGVGLVDIVTAADAERAPGRRAGRAGVKRRGGDDHVGAEAPVKPDEQVCDGECGRP